MSAHFAMFQHSLDSLDAERVGRAFDALPWLVRADARRLVRGAYGVLVDRLEHAEAQALKDAMSELDLAVEAVPQDWLTLPSAQSCRRLVPSPEGLRVEPVMGTEVIVPWPELLLLGVGIYSVAQRNVKPATVGSMLTAPASRFSRSYAPGGDDVGSGSEIEYTQTEHAVLDLVTAAPARYRIRLDQFDYSGLGDRRGHSAWQNFPRLVRVLVEHAPGAAQNSGLRTMGPDARQLARYPGRSQFERELAWSLWRYVGPGRALGVGQGLYRTAVTGPNLDQPLCRDTQSGADPSLRQPARSRALVRQDQDLQAPSRSSMLLGHGRGLEFAIKAGIGIALVTGLGLWLGPFGGMAAAVLVLLTMQRMR